MRALNIASVGNAKTVGAGNCDRSRRKLRTNRLIVDTAQRIWPVKTAWQLFVLTGYPERTVETWLTGNVKIPADALVALFHTDAGRDFLVAVMDDKRPGWWKQALAYFAAIDALALSRAARRVLRRAFDATESTSKAIERADALLVQDADFYGEHNLALRSMDRVPHSALARQR